MAAKKSSTPNRAFKVADQIELYVYVMIVV